MLRLNVPVNNFSDGATASWVINQFFWRVKCLAQGHNTAAIGFEPATSRSGESLNGLMHHQCIILKVQHVNVKVMHFSKFMASV